MEIAPDKTDNLDDLLTCSICLETFREPKYLPCLHTFCKTCINTYILSTVRKEKTTTNFKCPICRQNVLMGESTGNPETWADKLPGNHFVASMMDRQAIRRSKKMCDSCKANNESKNALSWCIVCEEAFCESCEKCHKSFKMTAKHPIMLLNDLVSNKETVSISSLVYCEEHQGEIVKAYCVDHSKPLCTLCATLMHRKCEDVVTIEAAVQGIKKSEKAMTLSTELKETSKQLSDLIQNRKDRTTDFEREAQVMITKVSSIKDNIVKHLIKVEGLIEEEINKSKKEVSLKLFEKSVELESMKSTVDNWITIFDTCLQHGSELQCLLQINKINENKDNFSDLLTKGISEIKNFSMLLEVNDIVDEFSKQVAAIGVVKVIETDASCPNFLLRKTVNFHTGNINVNFVIDLTGNNVYLSGIFMNSELIFTHFKLSKVLKYNNNGCCLTYLSLPDKPFDIVQLSDTTAAVSTNNKTLFVVDIQKMIQCRKIDVLNEVHGFRHVNGEFILACNTTLTWINASSGAKIEQTSTNGDTYYIHANSRKDYICTDGKSVSKMVNNAKVFTYKSDKFLNPRGIDIDRDGNVYICGNVASNLHQLDKDGKLVRIIPVDSIGIKRPYVIRFKKNSNQFLVTCYETGKVVICEID
ncbi:uncharacterized protein LOC143057066 [Mytilus galloprovincialis]|uniref:uncharacterized protein LOC143057066 n=1 Tax=Mytilus galloprovincialis TaxID=29158 RepID=UPI003F7BA5E2